MKAGCAALAVAANVTCIMVVLHTRRADAGLGEGGLSTTTDRLLLSAKLGIPLAAVAAGIGFWLAHGRLAAALLRS